MEELVLSHILNAEGEKLQFILGTLEGVSSPEATIDQVLQANESVKDLLEAVSFNQMILRSKMRNALSASATQNPASTVIALQVQGTNEAPRTILPDDAVIFDEILAQTGDVSYDPATSVFSLNSSGIFL